MKAGGQKNQKIYISEIKSNLIDGIVAIDNDESLSRSVKTKKISRLADSIKNQLHDDGRVKDAKKIAVSTYRKYLTQLRRMVREQNWVHHSLSEQVSRLERRYPHYSNELNGLIGLSIDELITSHRALVGQVRRDKNDRAHAEIKAMKLDHEMLRHLTLPSAQKESLDIEQIESRDEKISNQVTLDYAWLIQTIRELLTTKTKSIGGKNYYAYNRLALGLSLATGRRAIEVLYQGDFKKTHDNQVKFVGQAKKTGGANGDVFNIFTLVDADLVINAFKALRSLDEIKGLSEFDSLNEVERNEKINLRCAKNLNTLTKRIFNNEKWVFKDSRDLWARAVRDVYYPDYQKKTKKSEDKFWQEQLGHESIETQVAYKKFNLVFDNYNEEDTETNDTKSQLDVVKTLDNHPEIERRGSLQKIHANVKIMLEESPDLLITQSLITREVGSGRAVIKDYLDLVESAKSGEVKASAPAPKNEKTESKDKDKKSTDQASERPRFSATNKGDNDWHVLITVGDSASVFNVNATSQHDAMKTAWELHTGELSKFTVLISYPKKSGQPHYQTSLLAKNPRQAEIAAVKQANHDGFKNHKKVLVQKE